MTTSKTSSGQASSSHFYPDIDMNFKDERSKSQESKTSKSFNDSDLINDSFGSRTTTSKSNRQSSSKQHSHNERTSSSLLLDIKSIVVDEQTDATPPTPPDPLGFDDVVKDVFVTEVSEASMMLSRNRRGLCLAERIRAIPGNAAETVAKINNHQSRDLFIESEEHIMSLRYTEALSCLHRAIHLMPNSALFYVQRGEIYLHLCDFSSAILNYKKACLLEPKQTELFDRLAFLYYMLAQILYDQCLYVESLDAISMASEMKPDNVAYKIRSIACLAALRRHNECLSLVNKHIQKLSPEAKEHEKIHYADIYVLRARLHQRFSNISLCYYDVRDALSIHPGHVEAELLMNDMLSTADTLRTQAVHLKLLSRPVDALRKITVAIATNPSCPELHIVRGSLNRNVFDFNSAIDDYLMAMDKTSHCETNEIYKQAQRQLLLTYNDFAVECFQKEFYSEAIILLNKAIKGEKKEAGLYINRGDCFLKEQNLEFALADYEQALEMTSPHDPHVTSTPGLDEPSTPSHLHEDPDHDNDAKLLSVAIKTRIAVVYSCYGNQHFTAKNFQPAIDNFSKAIENDASLSTYYIARAKSLHLMACGKENIIAKARDDLVVACKLNKDDPGIHSLLTRLFPGKSLEDVTSMGKKDMHRLPALPAIPKSRRRRGQRDLRFKMTLAPSVEPREVNAFDAKVKDTLTSRPDLSGHPVKVNNVMYPPKILI